MFDVAGKKVPSTLAEIVDPRHTALVLWDMQAGIAPRAFNHEALLPRLRTFAAQARARKVPVFYSIQADLDLATEETGVWMKVRAKRAGLPDPAQLLPSRIDPKRESIVPELSPQPGDTVFRKRRPNGFHGTDLDLILRNRGIRAIILGGVSTEAGVEATARSARDLGYEVVVLSDGTGSLSREAHELALRLMSLMYFDLATTTDIAGVWGAA
ncbi:MAG: cysteine hydrolase [Burkholderiales bacterium]|nr:cysteine hydrolase [Burkholderiales bacterium]